MSISENVLPELPALPRDDNGPVFCTPWEAKAFALAVTLQEAGYFTWSEWAECLATEIKSAQVEGDPDLGTTYYRHWLCALERMVVEKGVATSEELVQPGGP